ncbi:hypothetical protein NHJ6243_010106 [Beauveria neobassiana]
MIRRALTLRPFLEQLILKHRQQWEQENRSKRTGGIRKSAKEPRICMEVNQLTSNDWVVLEHLAKLLGFYEDAVRTLEGDGQLRKRKRGWVGSYGNVWEVIQGFEFLLEALEGYKQLACGIPDPEHFRINVNLGWEKLNKYYRLLDDTPIYCTALALHPAFRWGVMTGDSAAKRQRKYYNPFQAYCERTRSVSGSAAVKDELADADRFDGEDDEDELELWQSSWEDGDGDVRDPLSYWHERYVSGV